MKMPWKSATSIPAGRLALSAPMVMAMLATQGAASEATVSGQPADPTAAVGVTAEQVRTAINEARKRRDALLEPDSAVTDPAARQALLERWGVEVIGARLSARGYMIDFRFRVLDAQKALPLFDSRIRPYLVREGSEIRLPVTAGQKVGMFRPTNRGRNIVADKDYHIMFGNPDSYVKPGQKVDVVIGDFRAAKLTLQ